MIMEAPKQAERRRDVDSIITSGQYQKQQQWCCMCVD